MVGVPQKAQKSHTEPKASVYIFQIAITFYPYWVWYLDFESCSDRW